MLYRDNLYCGKAEKQRGELMAARTKDHGLGNGLKLKYIRIT